MIITGKFSQLTRILLFICMIGIAHNATCQGMDDAAAQKALDDAKAALSNSDYDRMWQEMDKITKWLEAKAPRSGLAWEQAEQMIKDWIKKNWNEDVLEVKALSEGGMETTTERHQGSFEGWTWDTGEKTVTKDFVFEAEVKAVNGAGKILNHQIRFHFDKGPAGWFIDRAGVM